MDGAFGIRRRIMDWNSEDLGLDSISQPPHDEERVFRVGLAKSEDKRGGYLRSEIGRAHV